MNPRTMMFVLPLVVLGLSRLGAEVSFRLLPMRGALVGGLAAYYVAIAASALWVRRKVPGARHAPALRSGRRPSARRVLVAIVLPALPLAVFFSLHVAPVAPAIAAAVIVFAAVNACFEETFWRGLMAHLPAPDWIRILYPAALFSFMHWFNMAPYLPLGAGTFAVLVTSTFALGVVWMWFQLREGSLLYPIASHFAIDAFALLALVMSIQPRLG
jgi:membrane protease YdiL (CAAX protease family)